MDGTVGGIPACGVLFACSSNNACYGRTLSELLAVWSGMVLQEDSG